MKTEVIITKKTYNSIDLAKFFAAILVVAIHSRPFAGNELADYFFTSFLRIAVPFFFVATGFFFFLKEKPDIRRYTWRLASLYVLWFIIEIYFVYQRFFVDYDHSLPIQLFNFFRSLLFSNTWYASWFIMACIIAVNIIYYLSRKLNNWWLLLVGFGAYLISLFCSSYSGVLDLILNERLRYYHVTFSYFFMPANSFIVALVYIAIGKFIAEKMVRERKYSISKSMNVGLLALVTLAGCAEVVLIRWSVLINDAYLFLPFFTFFAFVLLLDAEVKIHAQVSKTLRSMSILIYILHGIFVSVNPALFGIKSGMVMFGVTLIESVVSAYLIVKLSEKVPVLKKLY